MTDQNEPWALDKAARECGYSSWERVVAATPLTTERAIRAFARYIAAHEDEPVDPDLELAREVCAKDAEDNQAPITAHGFRNGAYDSTSDMRLALAAIKAVREQGK